MGKFILVFIFFLLIWVVSVASPVSGDTVIDEQNTGPSNQVDPFQYYISGYGVEHTTPNPYLVSQLNEKLEQVKSNNSGSELQHVDRALSSTMFPSNYRPGLRSLGDNRLLVIIVDFADSPHGSNQTREEIIAGFNGPGTPGSFSPHDSVKGFYERSSYGKLNLTADVYGWYRAAHERQYYEQIYGHGRQELVKECMNAFDGEVDYSQYDNDNDGDIDNVYIIWTGSDFNEFWWGYYMGLISSEEWDGLPLDSIIWEPYSWGGYDCAFCPLTTNHETGHLLGLPDYYDYDGSVGPCGGVGGFDLMAGVIDHNCFSKYLLDWIDPVVITEGEHIIHLDPSSESPDAVILMPGGSNGPYTEFFMVQTRNPGNGNDNSYTWWYALNKQATWSSPGLAIWHVDASLNLWGDWMYDNSYSAHKMLRLMEADGLEELEQSCQSSNNWDPADLYYPGQTFGPDTAPNSVKYDGSATGIQIDQITQDGSGMTMRIQINPSNPTPIPPAGITYLTNTTYRSTFIHWVWTDPMDTNFDHVMVYLNNSFQTNVTKGIQFFNATGLVPGNQYTISTRTVDTSNTFNQTWVNQTTWTAPIPKPFPENHNIPTDPDGDDLYDDLNGNGRIDFNDIVLFFNYLEWIPGNQPVQYFDYNGNKRIDFNDLILLFNII